MPQWRPWGLATRTENQLHKSSPGAGPNRSLLRGPKRVDCSNSVNLFTPSCIKCFGGTLPHCSWPCELLWPLGCCKCDVSRDLGNTCTLKHTLLLLLKPLRTSLLEDERPCGAETNRPSEQSQISQPPADPPSS